jgi:trimeric autotransporter adhesin
MRRIASISVVFSTLLLISITFAQQPASTAVPNLIRYSGVLKDAQGAALSSATTGVTFAIYKQQDGGAAVWMETQNVASDASGSYNVLLGSTTATGLPTDLFSQEEQRWLGVQVQGQAEQPRVLLVSVPYAFKAHEAETLAGKSISDFVLAKDLNSNQTASGSGPGASSVSNTSPAAKPENKTKKEVIFQGPTVFSGATTDQIVSVMQGGTGNAIVASTDSAVTSNAVLGSITGRGVAIFGQAYSTSAQAYGVEGSSASTIGIGLLGFATATTGQTYGLKGYSSSTSGTGVRGLSTATTGSTFGVSGTVSSPSGIGMWGQAAANGGTGVWGQSVAASGTTTGVLATAASDSGTGIKVIEYAHSGTTYGLNAIVQSAGGTAGVFNNTAGGKVLSGQNNGVEVFSVDGDGSVHIGSYRALSIPGYYNLFVGQSAGQSNSSEFNTFVGPLAGAGNTTGSQNSFFGKEAGIANTAGYDNTFVGADAGGQNVTGSYNTYLGVGAGIVGPSGSNNVYVGFGAGQYNTGSNDIYIGNDGCPRPCAENDTIRIGGATTVAGPQTAAYIAGIYGSASSSGIPVYINSDGLLGTQVSSLRFKEQIADMGDSSSRLFQLRPVTFFYKQQYDDGSHLLQYGLIAEEVAKVYPDLVAYDKDGAPYTVKYQYLAPMLLNELQKQHAVVAAQQDVIHTQQEQIKQMLQRLSRLESLIPTPR